VDQNIEANIISALLTGHLHKEDVDIRYFEGVKTKPIAEAVLKLKSDGIEPDIVTIKNQNKSIDHNVVVDIVSNTLPSSHLGNLKVLKDLYNRRELAKTIKDAYEKLHEMDEKTDDIGIQVENKISEVLTTGEFKADNMDSIAKEFLKDLKSSRDQQDRYLYGIPMLDKWTWGLHPEEVTTVAARSGVGKTAFAIQIALRLVTNGLRVLIVSREMSSVQILKRMFAQITRIDGMKFRKRSFTADEWTLIEELTEDFKKYKLHINTDISNVNDIKKRIREIKPDVVIVDYLQLLTPTTNEGSREREVATMSRELKNMTATFKIPIIQLSQLNGEAGEKRPMGEGHVRESRAIYQNSNNVIYLHEPCEAELKKYISDGILTKEYIDKVYGSDGRLLEIILDKQRDGITGRTLQEYDGKLLKFKPLPDFMEMSK
jgi:replicative DNA helicase